MRLILSVMVCTAIAFIHCSCEQEEIPENGFKLWTAHIVNQYPHDTGAFTQGLTFFNGYLYESTGLYGSSSLRQVELETGRVLQQVRLSRRHFGEGNAVVDDRIFFVTWTSQTAFVYDLESFEQLGTFSYEGEAWGLTYDGQKLIMSDGTNRLRFYSPDDFELLGVIEVFDPDGNAVTNLNELEYIEGHIFANIWKQDRIARIDPSTGSLTGWLYARDVFPAHERSGTEDVLNGIAYDSDTGRVFITGKLWPWLYEIEMIPIENPVF